MCGIVGLFLKTDRLAPQLGALTSAMLATMSERGPDSAGFAVYGRETSGLKVVLRGRTESLLANAVTALQRAFGEVAATVRATHATLDVAQDRAQDRSEGWAENRVATMRRWLEDHAPDVDVVSVGCRMEIFKEVGRPTAVAARFGLAAMSGTHAIGHTRMATESAVTTDGAHPFSTGSDQCLVHNGSLSNHNDLRRTLEHKGLHFATRNDTEVAAGYLTWRLREGASLEEALRTSLNDLDGFFTFVVGTKTGFAVLRDPIACKPAVMAETDDYVAFGSEYRALVGLPGIDAARVFEPAPARVYVWERA